MLLLNALRHIHSLKKNKNGGFTLIEMLATVLVAGILIALTAPSFATWYKNKQAQDGLDQLEGALKEAQRQAIRKSQSCSVQFTANTGSSITSPTQGCLLSDRELSDQVSVATNLSGTPPTIAFSYKGNTTTSATIVISPADGGSGEKRCLVISNGLGIIRTGEYSATASTSPPTEAGCTTE